MLNLITVCVLTVRPSTNPSVSPFPPAKIKPIKNPTMKKENANISFIISIMVTCSNNIFNVLHYNVLLKLISLAFCINDIAQKHYNIYILHIIYLLDRILLEHYGPIIQKMSLNVYVFVAYRYDQDINTRL